MTRHDIQSIICAALWTGAIALGITGSLRGDLVALFWAVEVTVLAALATAHVMMEVVANEVALRERMRIEELGDQIAAAAIRQCSEEGVTRLR